MKRFRIVLFILTLLILITGAEGESTISYYIPEKEVSVEIPVSYHCITRNSGETDSFFQKLSIDVEEMKRYMLQNDIYLDGLCAGLQSEIVIIITGAGGIDLNSMSYEKIESYVDTIADQYKKSLAKNITGNIYKGKYNTGICIHYDLNSLSGMNQSAVQYILVHENEMYNIRLLSYGGSITSAHEEMIQSVFNSFEWGREDYSSELKDETKN